MQEDKMAHNGTSHHIPLHGEVESKYKCDELSWFTSLYFRLFKVISMQFFKARNYPNLHCDYGILESHLDMR